MISSRKGLALGQAGGQADRGCVEIGIFCDDLQFGLLQRGVQGGQDFFHVFLAPAAGGAGGGLNFRAIDGLQGQAHRPGAQGQLHGLSEDRAQGLFVIAPEAPELL